MLLFCCRGPCDEVYRVAISTGKDKPNKAHNDTQSCCFHLPGRGYKYTFKLAEDGYARGIFTGLCFHFMAVC